RRSDVWALGAVAYYLLSGQPPYVGPNQLQTLQALANGDPPPPLPDDVPPALREVVLRALARRASDRFVSAEAMQYALEDAAKTCGMATNAKVASFMAEPLRDRIEARRHALDLAVQAAADRSNVNRVLREAAAPESSRSLHANLVAPPRGAD